MGDNDLTAFPPHIEKFVHLEVVSCMNSTLEHDHTHVHTACTSNMITHIHTTCTLVVSVPDPNNPSADCFQYLA